MNVIRYPSKDDATRFRAELQNAVEAARRDAQPEQTMLAWPAELDRRLLLGLAVKQRTGLCIQRERLACGDGPYTVAQLLRVPHLSPTVLRDLLLATDAFLASYIETFDDVPGPADVAAMRLRRVVQSLTPTQCAIVEERLLTDPPVDYHTLVLRLELSAATIRSRLLEAQRRFNIALGPELRIIAAELEKKLGANQGDVVDERIDALLDGVLPDHGNCTARRARAFFRQALTKELSLPTRQSESAPASIVLIT